MLRRILISTVCISVAALSPVPLPACAMLMKFPAECGPAMPAATKASDDSHCEQMANEASESAGGGATLRSVGPERSCCSMTPAPVPDARASATQPEAASAFAPVAIGVSQGTAPALVFVGAETGRDSGPPVDPPSRQAFLCTFLI